MNSASKDGPLPGRTPNGGPPSFIRRPRNVDPLVQKRKPRRLPPSGLGARARPADSGTQQRNVNNRPQPIDSQHSNGGWTYPPSEIYKDYPLYTTKKALRE